MTDKLTDKEIVKALECCINNLCPNCPLGQHTTGTYNEHCGDDLMKNALNLINRLQEKDETRHKVFETKCEELEIAKAENERLKDYVDTVEKEVDWYRDELRHSDKKVENKVYKKVFEKLNDKSIRSKAKVKGCGFLYVSVVTLHDINALKKKLVGEDNAEEKEQTL